jgi:hypothetical protein
MMEADSFEMSVLFYQKIVNFIKLSSIQWACVYRLSDEMKLGFNY